MAGINSNTENETHELPRTRSFYRPTEDDFNRILVRLRAQGDRKTLQISPTILDERDETKEQKVERLRQEALQRDQYLLSMRPNRHVVFAAKFAKIKNQGLTKRFEKQVHIWSQEMERNFRVVGTNEKALERELRQSGNRKDKKYSVPHLRAAETFGKPQGHLKRHSIRLPKLTRRKERTDEAEGANEMEQGILKGGGEGKSEEIEFSNTNVRLPPIEAERKGSSHIE